MYVMKIKTHLLFVAIGLIFFIGISLPANANSHSKDRAFIQDAVRKMDVAGMKKDADGYVAFTHPDFVDVNLAGQETTHGKAELRQNISRLFAHAVSIVMHTTITNMTFSNNGVLVTETTEGEIKMSVKGQDRVIKNRSSYRDFWVRSGKGWLEKRSQTIALN